MTTYSFIGWLGPKPTRSGRGTDKFDPGVDKHLETLFSQLSRKQIALLLERGAAELRRRIERT